MSGERVVSGPFSLCLESGAVTKLPPPYPWGFFYMFPQPPTVGQTLLVSVLSESAATVLVLVHPGYLMGLPLSAARSGAR
jgi:hypothetical protein